MSSHLFTETRGASGAVRGSPEMPFRATSAEGRVDYTQLATEGALPGENIELHFVPIHDLERRRVTTFFCSPVFCVEEAPIIYGYRAFQGVGARDMPYIDRAILGHTVKFARKLAQAGTVAAIGTSVNYATLSWPKGREIYEQALKAAGVGDCPFLLLKIEDVPSGASPGELAEVVAHVREYVKRIFVHIPDMETSIQRCGNLGVSGLVLSLPPRPTRMSVMAASKWLLRECEAQTAHSCVDYVESEETLDLVRVAGVRFAAGTALGTTAFCGSAHPQSVEYYMAEVRRAGAARSVEIAAEKVSEH